MRKDLWKLAVPAAALLLALSGCSGQKAPEETAASAEETEETAEETAAEETETGETEEERKVRNGNPFFLDGSDGAYRVYGPNGDFLALSRLEQGRLVTIKSFFEV